MRRFMGTLAAMAALAVAAADAHAASLRGSPAAMQEQNAVAKSHGLTFYRTPAQIRGAVDAGELVELQGNENYEVADFVRFPYLQPEVVVFVERLSQQYREACGQKLVVTSAVRPASGQPANAHRLSVHPAGMAVDLRVSDRASCRSWLEDALLGMESRGLINGIREFHPPHYHVAVYPEPYIAYVEERLAAEREAEREAQAAAEAASVEPVLPASVTPAVAGFVADEASASTGSGAPVRLAAVIALLLAAPVGLRIAGIRIRRR